LILSTSPLPISLLDPCIGSTEKRCPSRTFKWPPLPGSNVQPCFSSHRLNSALVTQSGYNTSVVFGTSQPEDWRPWDLVIVAER